MNLKFSQITYLFTSIFMALALSFYDTGISSSKHLEYGYLEYETKEKNNTMTFYTEDLGFDYKMLVAFYILFASSSFLSGFTKVGYELTDGKQKETKDTLGYIQTLATLGHTGTAWSLYGKYQDDYPTENIRAGVFPIVSTLFSFILLLVSGLKWSNLTVDNADTVLIEEIETVEMSNENQHVIKMNDDFEKVELH